MPLFLDLPLELLLQIWDTLDPESDECARNALVRTCHFVYSNFNSLLYRGTVQSTARSVRALEWAAERGQMRTIHKLLNAGVGPADDTTALLAAAKAGHEDVIQSLLWHDFDPNRKGHCGFCTPIHRAAENGHVEIIKDLLDSGADINSLDHEDYTAFEKAVLEGHANVVSFFLERDVSKDAIIRERGSPLAWAARSGKEEVIETLLEAGANIEAITEEGETVLHWAARGGNPKAVALLLQKGAAPNIPDRRGQTPLHFACLARAPSKQIITFLFQHNVEIDPRALSDGRTPLAIAASRGFAAAIKPLLEKGADPTIKDADGCTALALAARFGHADSALAILDGDADIRKRFIDIPDNCGRTPLFLATLHGHEHIVRLLLTKGSLARKNLTTAGRSPLSFANDHQEGKKNLRSIWEFLACPYYANIDIVAIKKASQKARRSVVYARCDQCQFGLSVYDNHFHCVICNDNDFDICMECFGSGYTCFDLSHVLQKFGEVEEDCWGPVSDEPVYQNTLTVAMR